MSMPRTRIRFVDVLIGLLFCLCVAISPLYADKKKKYQPALPPKTILDRIDFSRLVWPNPPAPTRVKYLNYFCCDRYIPEPAKKKNSWMDRMAGG